MDQLPTDVNLDDRELVKIEAMISSFTTFERKDPNALIREPGRVARIAKGSGVPDQAVSELVQRFLFMKQMMGNMGGMGGLLGNIPGMKQLGAMKNMAKQMQGMGGFPGMGGMGGFPGMGGMGGFPGMPPGMGGFPGMAGFPGMGGPPAESMTKMKALSEKEKNAKKAQRKREKDARKKNRR
jgi:signal recognition particle subunit SRP54